MKAGETSEHAPESLVRVLQSAIRANASDVHLQMRQHGAEVAFRMDGVLVQIATLPCDVGERICGRIKYLAELKTYQDSLPQDGRIERSALDLPSDLRVATYPTVTGEKIVLRLFQEGPVKSIAELGFPGDVQTMLMEWLNHASGLLLLTGPAGSGKTTTIYACLQHLQQRGGLHIITVEDPVERVIPGLMQTETNEERGLSFACAARHLLRQDPQVLAIGEIRDEETARIALRASLTGHMVLSTIHAGSCSGVLERLAAYCPELPLTGPGRALILNQRLVRRVCRQCKGNRCGECLQTGFRGRMPLVEFLPVDDIVRRLLREARYGDIKVAKPLGVSGQELAGNGMTTADEISRAL